MKLIDDQGRLFGKINVIDFLVIIFFACILGAFYLGYQIMLKKPPVVDRKLIKVELKGYLTKIPPELSEQIKAGDVQVNQEGNKIGEIIWLGEISPYQFEFDTVKGENVAVEATGLKKMAATLGLKAELRWPDLYYVDRPVKIGSPLEFSSNKYQRIIFIPESIEVVEYKMVDLFITLKDLDEDVLKEIAVGDKELNAKAEIVAEILSLGEIKSSSFKVDLGGGNFVAGENIHKKEISAKMKLRCQIVEGGNFYFKGVDVKRGNSIEFQTEKYKVTGVITEAFAEPVEEVLDLFITLKDLDEDVLKEIAVGDKELDEKGEVIAEVLSLGKIENSSFEFNLGEGNFVAGEASNKKQISGRMRLKCQIRKGNKLYFKGKEVKHNRPFEFKTDRYTVKAIAAKTFEKTSPLKEKWISLQVKFTGVVPEITNVIQKGDIEKDSVEQTVARISEVINNKPSEVLVLKENSFISLSHPFHRDILASLDVRCIEKGGVYYFKNYPVKMGNNITFSTELYSITGLIVGLEIK